MEIDQNTYYTPDPVDIILGDPQPQSNGNRDIYSEFIDEQELASEWESKFTELYQKIRNVFFDDTRNWGEFYSKVPKDRITNICNQVRNFIDNCNFKRTEYIGKLKYIFSQLEQSVSDPEWDTSKIFNDPNGDFYWNYKNNPKLINMFNEEGDRLSTEEAMEINSMEEDIFSNFTPSCIDYMKSREEFWQQVEAKEKECGMSCSIEVHEWYNKYRVAKSEHSNAKRYDRDNSRSFYEVILDSRASLMDLFNNCPLVNETRDVLLKNVLNMINEISNNPSEEFINTGDIEYMLDDYQKNGQAFLDMISINKTEYYSGKEEYPKNYLTGEMKIHHVYPNSTIRRHAINIFEATGFEFHFILLHVIRNIYKNPSESENIITSRSISPVNNLLMDLEYNPSSLILKIINSLTLMNFKNFIPDKVCSKNPYKDDYCISDEHIPIVIKFSSDVINWEERGFKLIDSEGKYSYKLIDEPQTSNTTNS